MLLFHRLVGIRVPMFPILRIFCLFDNYYFVRITPFAYIFVGLFGSVLCLNIEYVGAYVFWYILLELNFKLTLAAHSLRWLRLLNKSSQRKNSMDLRSEYIGSNCSYHMPLNDSIHFSLFRFYSKIVRVCSVFEARMFIVENEHLLVVHSIYLYSLMARSTFWIELAAFKFIKGIWKRFMSF